MGLVVHLSEELSRRVEAAATERGVSPEEVALEAIEDRVGPATRQRRVPSFIGIGASGTSKPIGRLHREVIREHFASKAASDV